jgi:hypothetical protein
MEKVNLRYISKDNQVKLVNLIESLNSDMDILYRKIGADRTTWYRWREGISKLSIKRTVQICDALGLDLTEFITELEIEGVAYAKPHHKIEDIRRFFGGFIKAGLKKQAAAVMVEMAAVFQEVLTRNGIGTELYSKATDKEQYVRLACNSSLGGNFLSMSFHIKNDLPFVTVMDRGGLPLLDAVIGKTTLAEIVRIVLLFDKKDKKGEKDGIGTLEKIGSRITRKIK